jgi:hypothetical protein
LENASIKRIASAWLFSAFPVAAHTARLGASPKSQHSFAHMSYSCTAPAKTAWVHLFDWLSPNLKASDAIRKDEPAVVALGICVLLSVNFFSYFFSFSFIIPRHETAPPP